MKKPGGVVAAPVAEQAFAVNPEAPAIAILDPIIIAQAACPTLTSPLFGRAGGRDGGSK
jgi:hypothetical protein